MRYRSPFPYGARVALSLTFDDSRDTGRWVITAGHDVGERGEQTVIIDSLDALCQRATQADVWVAPVAEVAKYLWREPKSSRWSHQAED